MYKWLIAGTTIGFGLGLLVTSIIFETALKPFGNPLTLDYTTWDWNMQTNTWKFIGILWILIGAVVTSIIYIFQEKTKTS